MIRTFFFSLSLLLLSCWCHAQVTISGSVTDSASAALSYINVSVLTPGPNSSVIAYGTTDQGGNYKVSFNSTGTVLLTFSDLSFETKTVSIDLFGNKKTFVANVTLRQRQAQSLNEVIVRAKRQAIVVKKDTIIFDVNAFKQGDERVVEDLLRKIPGLTIDDNGNIRVGNQEVEKVMVEGDDFFEKGYKLLTKNMPVKPLDKVEVLQNYSNNKLLKGIEKTNKVALNLKLREDAKRVWFGTVEAAAGPSEEVYFDGRANLMNFGKKNKFYLFSNLNNTGYDATGNLDDLFRPETQTYIGDGDAVQPLMVKDFNGLDFKKERVNFNNTKLGSLNAILNPTPKFKLKISGLINGDQNSFFRDDTERYLLPDSSFTNVETDRLRKNKLTGYGKIDMSLDLSQTSTIDVMTRYNHGRQKDFSELTFNNRPLEEQLRSDDSRFDQKYIYTKKFSDKDVLLITGRIISEQRPQEYLSNSFNFPKLFPSVATANQITQSIGSSMHFYGMEGHWLKKKDSLSLFEISVGKKLRIDELTSDFRILNGTNVLEQPSDYQNQNRYLVNNLYLNAHYTYTFSRITLASRLNLSSLSTKYTSFASTAQKNGVYVNPRLEFKWKINDAHKLIGTYHYAVNPARIYDIYDHYLLLDYRNLSKGSGDTGTLTSSSYMLNYLLGNWTDRFFANLAVSFNRYHDYFANEYQIYPEYASSEKLLIHGKSLLNISSNIDLYLKPLSSNIKLNSGYARSTYQNIVNQTNFQNVTTSNYYADLQLRSSFNGIFNFNIGNRISRFTVETSTKNDAVNNYNFLELLIRPEKRFDVKTSAERYHFGNLSGKNSYEFLDISARYKTWKDKLMLSVTGKNLLNNRSFKNYTVSEISVSTVEYRLLPRFVLLGANYSF